MARFIDNASALEVEIVDDWMFLYSPDELSTLDPARWAWAFAVVSALLDKLEQWGRWRDDRLQEGAFVPRPVPVTATPGAAAPTPAPLPMTFTPRRSESPLPVRGSNAATPGSSRCSSWPGPSSSSRSSSSRPASSSSWHSEHDSRHHRPDPADRPREGPRLQQGAAREGNAAEPRVHDHRVRVRGPRGPVHHRSDLRLVHGDRVHGQQRQRLRAPALRDHARHRGSHRVGGHPRGRRRRGTPLPAEPVRERERHDMASGILEPPTPGHDLRPRPQPGVARRDAADAAAHLEVANYTYETGSGKNKQTTAGDTWRCGSTPLCPTSCWMPWATTVCSAARTCRSRSDATSA